GSQGGKKSLQARFFAAASQAASALAGFPPAPSRNKRSFFRLGITSMDCYVIACPNHAFGNLLK
ncbi:MAG TPA: hypothetical protein PK448_07580, partial [Bacteroidales bacterium]|nr:hypothetical protein [Bacteroidales bacterium]